jgi:hypothetical protein
MQLLARTGWCVAVCTLPVITLHSMCACTHVAVCCWAGCSVMRLPIILSPEAAADVNEPQFSGEVVHLCAAARGSSTLKCICECLLWVV